VIRFLFRLIRLLIVAVLGAALAAKFLLESHAEPETEEIDLVNIFGGTELVSSADPFFGGKVTNAFGGTILDLRKATPAPTGIDLDVLVAFGGVELVIPYGWKVIFEGSTYAGGFNDSTEPVDDPDAPVVRISGILCFGGVRAASRPQVEAVI
jgi:hypothetical protein